MEPTLPQKELPTPEVIEHDRCYLFRFAVGEAAAPDLRIELIDNELVVRDEHPLRSRSFPGFTFSRAIDAERSRAALAHGQLTVVVPKKPFVKHFLLPIQVRTPDRWMRIVNGRPYAPSVTALSEQVPVLTSRTTDRSECL